MLLVDLFIVALAHYWSLTFNSIVVVQVVIAIGLAVDYSAHIAHTYLTVEPPARLKSNKAKRKYKASRSLSQMGSSVFHGGFSTFLAISVLSLSKSYIFIVFFRMWFGIIIFAMANGFFLLPVVLSFIGPVNENKKKSGSGKDKPRKALELENMENEKRSTEEREKTSEEKAKRS